MRGSTAASDFLLIHFNATPLAEIPNQIKALKTYHKPILCNEDQKVGEQGAKAAALWESGRQAEAEQSLRAVLAQTARLEEAEKLVELLVQREGFALALLQQRRRRRARRAAQGRGQRLAPAPHPDPDPVVAAYRDDVPIGADVAAGDEARRRQSADAP